MKLPPFLLGAAILFWGWQTGFWLASIPFAVIYETARYINWRWNLTTAEFRQTSHVCTALLVGVLIYLFISDRSLQLIFSFFQWLPIICAPLLIAQAYSTSDRVDLNALLFFKEKENQQLLPLDLTYPYFAICILAASAANVRELSFYIGVVILINLALNSIRSQRYSYFVFFGLLLLATVFGTVGHIGLHQFQRTMERNTYRLFHGFYRPQTDPNKISTAIGDIGSVKRSNKILFRVKAAPGEMPPKLMRRATYNRYNSGFWGVADAEFIDIEPGEDQTTWQLQNHSQQTKELTISENLDEGQSLLKLPDGRYQLAKLPEADIEQIQQNQYGTVQVLSDASLLSYQVQYDPDLSGDSPPIAADLKVLEREQQALDQVATELDLGNKSPQEILATVDQFFNTKFEYSLELARQGKNKTPLSAFLLNHRSGHCEYFATATALLLRRAGIPARYAVGYSVHELSKLERQYIVRSRNAHAWTQVYIGGKWQAFDTTPASWISMEDRRASSWQNIQDLGALVSFKFAQIAVFFKNAGKTKFLWLLVLPMGFILIRQFFRQGQKNRLTGQRVNQRNRGELTIGADSEIYLIEQRLNKLGWRRDRAETWHDWLIRLRHSPETQNMANGLDAIIELHYRYCFDPNGITVQEREALNLACQTWLECYQLVPSAENRTITNQQST